MLMYQMDGRRLLNLYLQTLLFHGFLRFFFLSTLLYITEVKNMHCATSFCRKKTANLIERMRQRLRRKKMNYFLHVYNPDMLFIGHYYSLSRPKFRSLHLFFYKQLGSGLKRQSCLYFQGFWGSKLRNRCLIVLPSNLCQWGTQKSMFMISGLKIFPICF